MTSFEMFSWTARSIRDHPSITIWNLHLAHVIIPNDVNRKVLIARSDIFIKSIDSSLNISVWHYVWDLFRVRVVTVMLVTSLCWWLNDCDHFKMLVIKKYVDEVFLHVDDIPIGHNITICQNVMLVTDMLCLRHGIQPAAKFNKNVSIFKQILRDLHRSATS